MSFPTTLPNAGTDAYYWDQASIMFGDTQIGRAEGVTFKVVGNWKPYMVPGSPYPTAIYDYGSWVTGRIRKAYINGSILSLFANQLGTATYFQIVFQAESKTVGQAGTLTTTIKDAKFDWEASLTLEDYAREDIEFIAKQIISV
jgi:hypothetical protein